MQCKVDDNSKAGEATKRCRIILLRSFNLPFSLCACMLGHFGHVWLFVTLMNCGPPGSSVHGILQARILEWVAMTSSRGSSQPRDQSHISCLLHWQAGSLPLEWPGKPFLSAYLNTTWRTQGDDTRWGRFYLGGTVWHFSPSDCVCPTQTNNSFWRKKKN